MAASGAIKLIDVTQYSSGAALDGIWDIPTGATGAIFCVKITNSAIPDTLAPLISGKDEVTGTYYALWGPSAIGGDGTFIYVVYPAVGLVPGVGSGITEIISNISVPPKGKFAFGTFPGEPFDAKVSMTVYYERDDD